MVSATKRKSALAAVAALAAALCLAIVLPTDDQLIMTPSTHDNIQYLSIDSPAVDVSRELRFAAYDADCGVVQLCFAVGKNVNQFHYVSDNLALTVNGEPVQGFSHAARTTWKRKFIMILIDEVKPDSQICLTYGGKTITIE